MKYKKPIIAILAITSLLVGSCTATASSAIKHNASCTLKNQTVAVKQVIYKCVPINKKLLWRAVGKSNSSRGAEGIGNNSKQLRFEPWSENFNLNSMLQTSHDNFILWQKENATTGGLHGTIIQDGLPVDVVNAITQSHFFAVNTFKKYSPEKTIAIIGVSSNWIINASKNTFMGEIEYPNNNGHLCYPPNGNAIIACVSNHGAFYIINKDMPGISVRLAIRALGAHEYFHIVQIKLAKINYRQFYNKIPAWFIEGSAEFIGYLSASPTGNLYISQRPEMFSGQKATNFDLNNYYRNDQSSYPYDIGRSAIEYLVASNGFQPIMNILKNVGDGISFDTAFANEYKISLKDFYIKFNKAAINVPGLVK